MAADDNMCNALELKTGLKNVSPARPKPDRTSARPDPKPDNYVTNWRRPGPCRPAGSRRARAEILSSLSVCCHVQFMKLCRGHNVVDIAI